MYSETKKLDEGSSFYLIVGQDDLHKYAKL